MKEEVDLNNSDDTEGQSLSTKGVNLVPNDQVRLEYTKGVQHEPSPQWPRGRDREPGAIYQSLYTCTDNRKERTIGTEKEQ